MAEHTIWRAVRDERGQFFPVRQKSHNAVIETRSGTGATEEGPLQPKILAEAIDLMSPFMQDRHDPDIAVRQSSPVDEVPFILEKIPFDAKFRRNGSRHYPMTFDSVESLEQAGDVAIRLFSSPAVPRVAIDFVETVRGRLLNADGGQRVRSGSAQ